MQCVECACVKKNSRGASGICLQVEKSYCSCILTERNVELLLCLTTSFMGGGQSDIHPAMSDRQQTTGAASHLKENL